MIVTDSLLVKINTGGVTVARIRRALRMGKLKPTKIELVRRTKTKTDFRISGRNFEEKTEDVREAIEDNEGVQINEINDE